LIAKGESQEAIKIIDALLKKTPDDLDVNNLKARWLLNSRVPNNVRSAEQIYDRFLDRYPVHHTLWFNRALTRSLLKKYDQALSDLKRAMDLDAWKEPDISLANEILMPLKSAKPSEFKQIEDEVHRWRP